MSHAEIAFAIIVGVITAMGVIVSALLTAYAADRAAKLAAHGVDRQIMLNSAVKVAEFRQDWINDLRNAMVRFQGLGLQVQSTHAHEIFEAGAKIDLLMNRNDSRYQTLSEYMSDYIQAKSEKEKMDCLEPFLELCQDILKTEWEVLKKELRQITVLSTL
jgi:hypothetical protein